MDPAFASLEKALLKNLNNHLSQLLPHHQSVKEIYEYAVLPPGKLFRPYLALHLYSDLLILAGRKNQSTSSSNLLQLIEENLENPKNPLSLLCSFLEIHHAYTLVHDDMPCMDNDLIRRGKPSLHAHYSEVEALLIGDGLINLSYALLGDILRFCDPAIPISQLKLIIPIFTRLLGPKGIIHGQYLDIQNGNQNHRQKNEIKNDNKNEKENFEHVLNIHRLKTARLFQCALLGPLLIFKDTHLLDFSLWELGKSLYRIGDSMGVIFQLMDDHDDYVMNKNDPNNSFKLYPQMAKAELQKLKLQTLKGMDHYQLNNLKNYFQSYLNPK
jgi:geranylgeranyl pyrophosphate synthase